MSTGESQDPAPMFHAPFTTTVSAADGPRAAVPAHPFTDTVPLLRATREPFPGEDPHIPLPFFHLDLTDRPGAERIVRGQRHPGSVLRKIFGLFVHSSGNGYVGLTVSEEIPDSPPCPPSETAVLKIAFDPVTYAAELTAAARAGRLVLAHYWTSSVGDRCRALLPVAVDGDILQHILQAALTHPRSVLIAVTPPTTQP